MKGLFGLTLLLVSVPTVAADLVIEAMGVQSDKGELRLALYNDAKTFRQEEKSLRRLSRPAQKGVVRFSLESLPAGRYAVIIYHDADDNGKLNRFLGMIPTEGYGLSGNPEVSGPPAFDDADFELGSDGVRLSIELRY